MTERQQRLGDRRLKALFIHNKDGMSVEDAVEIAKAEAERLGMGDVRMLKALDVLWSNRCGGWCVVVYNRW